MNLNSKSTAMIIFLCFLLIVQLMNLNEVYKNRVTDVDYAFNRTINEFKHSPPYYLSQSLRF